MKIEAFKQELRTALTHICKEKGWSFDNAKHRGMAFEDWCFELLCSRYATAENIAEDCIFRGDDAGIDIYFESKETEEVYILQCKHPKIAASDPIPEEEVKSFFSNYELLRDKRYLNERQSKNSRYRDFCNEFQHWLASNYVIRMIFISSGELTLKITALIEKLNRDSSKANVKFDVWDISLLRDEYVAVQSIEEAYPDDVVISIADAHFMEPKGELENITFVVPGTTLQQLARQHKDSLFNWNIRRFLGKKGEVNAGLTDTLKVEPQHFYYYNNGVSALCDSFSFDETSKKLRIRKLQIVNGAQTVGALRHADPENAKRAHVLVKLTAVKHSGKEVGIAASLIKTNNTQNILRVPDFRSNDPIQLWLEEKFRTTKPRGDLQRIVYGRKRPYPRANSAQQVIKLQELGKIRYAWLHDPRIPIAAPVKLFQLPDEGGLYGYAFGSEGEVVDLWSDAEFQDALLAIHSYNKLLDALNYAQSESDDLKQIARLKYYALKLFKTYLDTALSQPTEYSYADLCAFGGKYDAFFERASKIIIQTLGQSYRDILRREEGTAFSLPRDAKLWQSVKQKFDDNLAFLIAVSQPNSKEKPQPR